MRVNAVCITAACVILIAEVGARLALVDAQGARARSLRELVEGYVRELRHAPRDTGWVLGNSVLGMGADLGALRRGGSVPLPLGTANLASSVTMAEFYLREIEHGGPAQLVFCVNKDDLNREGARSHYERQYRNYPLFRGRSPAALLALSRERQRLKNTLRTTARGLLSGHDGAPSSTAAVPSFSGVLTPAQEKWLWQLSRNFTMDVESLGALGEIRQRTGIPVAVVLFPHTPAYEAFHDTKHPDLPVDAIRRALLEGCRDQGTAFLDLSRSIQDADLYRDPYHLNELGREAFTRTLLRELARLLPVEREHGRRVEASP